jgi:hypothetical protein
LNRDHYRVVEKPVEHCCGQGQLNRGGSVSTSSSTHRRATKLLTGKFRGLALRGAGRSAAFEI